LTRCALLRFQKFELTLPETEHRCPDTSHSGNLADLIEQFVGKDGAHGDVRLFAHFSGSIDGVFQNLARFEGKDSTSFDSYGFARLGITPSSVGLPFDDKIAEPCDLDLFAILQGFLQDAENGFDHFSGFLLGESNLLVNSFNDVGFGHNNLNLQVLERIKKGKFL
jgi:hypothetical protein